MKYLLVIFFSLFISISSADDLNSKAREEDKIKIQESIKLIGEENNGTSDKRAYDFLKKISKRVSDKKENYKDYNLIKKGNFILIENKTQINYENCPDGERIDFNKWNTTSSTYDSEPCEGIRFFGNEGFVRRSIDDQDSGILHFLISKPTPYNCHDYRISESSWKDNDWYINDFPLVDYRHYKKEMGLYTIPYFGKNSKAVVIALDGHISVSKSLLIKFLIIDTVSGKHDVVDSIFCSQFPLSIIKAANINDAYKPYTGKTTGILKGNIKNGKPEGEWVEYYENDKLMKKGNYKNGKEEGNWEEYWDNGKLKSKVSYKDGKEEGEEFFYYENGQLGVKRNYKDGKEEGEWLYYKENGQLIQKGNNKDGKGEGEWFEYWDNDKLKSKRIYKEGSLETEWLYYKDNGQLDEKGSYQNGYLHGEFLYYYKNGQLSSKSNYRNGTEVGEWVQYDENGQETWKNNYDR